MLVKSFLDQKKRDVITTTSAMSVAEAMELLISNKISCLPVVDSDGKLIGIVSDKDIFKKVHETKGQYHDLKVGDVMTKDLIVGLLTDDMNYVANVMDKNWIRHIPIVEGDLLVGLVSEGDVMRNQMDHINFENRYLNLYLTGMGHRDRSAE